VQYKRSGFQSYLLQILWTSDFCVCVCVGGGGGGVHMGWWYKSIPYYRLHSRHWRQSFGNDSLQAEYRGSNDTWWVCCQPMTWVATGWNKRCEQCVLLILRILSICEHRESYCGVMFKDRIAYYHVDDDFEKTVINHRRGNFVTCKC
jgi:hypothetical protein